MDIKDFITNSQKVLGKVIQNTDISLEDTSRFTKFQKPVILDNINFEAYGYDGLHGFHPNPSCPSILYTIFVLVPPTELKNKFIEESIKQAKNEPYDKEIIGEYYNKVFPGNIQVKNILSNIASYLNSIFPNKNYQFLHLLTTITKYQDFVLVFIDSNSASQLEQIYNDKVPFDFESNDVSLYPPSENQNQSN